MIVNPRLIDYFGLSFTQEDVDFVIPHLREDIPLAIDPFLLWKSERGEYRELHAQLVAFFDGVRDLELAGDGLHARQMLAACTEPRALGLGYAKGSKRGSSVGPGLADRLIEVYREIPDLAARKLDHLEMLTLLVPGIAEDRISDITAAVLHRFLIDFTRDRAQRHGIPMKLFNVPNVWDAARKTWRPDRAELPFNPLDDTPLLFAPLDLLRHLPWISYEDYYRSGYARLVLPPALAGRKVSKEAVLAYNRASFGVVERYVHERERDAAACKPDPLFEPLQLATLRKKYQALRQVPVGRGGGSDKDYEEVAGDLLSSLLYPELEFAAAQVRTVSGAHIRDVIFYNDGKTEFLRDLRQRYDARQPVFELKNVRSLDGEHVNQLYRYMDGEFGRFGVLVTRNPLPNAVRTNIVDLHSSKRAVVLCLDDTDFDLMLALLDAGRRPVEALKKRFIEFTRWLPK